MATTAGQPSEVELRPFRDRCRAAGLALTHQREVIYRAVCAMRNHPAPEAIYERVKAEIPSISLGTVYKNLKTFLDTGLLREVSPMHGSLRVDANTMEHHHLICTGCRSVFDLGADDLEPARLRRPLPEGFVLHRCAVELYGVCASCATQRDQS